MSKTEINLRRLLAAMPNQTNQAKLAQYVITLKEQLAILTGESGQGNLPCISEEKAMEYANQIESAASRIDSNKLNMWEWLSSKDNMPGVLLKEPDMDSQEDNASTVGLRKRFKEERRSGNTPSSALELDSATIELIEKHRHLQDDLTDEMVGLARQIKEASLAMNQAVHDSDKIVDSTERGLEHSLAATKQANVRSQGVYSQGFKTGCVTWLVIFVMFSMFLLMVFFIRIT